MNIISKEGIGKIRIGKDGRKVYHFGRSHSPLPKLLHTPMQLVIPFPETPYECPSSCMLGTQIPLLFCLTSLCNFCDFFPMCWCLLNSKHAPSLMEEQCINSRRSSTRQCLLLALMLHLLFSLMLYPLLPLCCNFEYYISTWSLVWHT